MKPIKITCDAKGTDHWLALDDLDIVVPSAGATFNRAPGVHYLAWWMIGKPGDAIKVEASVDGTSLAKVDTQIPAGEDKAGGVLKLEVK